MAIVGIVVGLVAGGVLVTYLSWRWVLFVNVPIGLVVAALAARLLPETGRSSGRFDLPGAITATAWVSLRSQAAAAARAGGHATGARAAVLQAQIYHHALATGFSRGYPVSAGVLALALIIALFMMRVSRADLSGAGPAPERTGDASSPGPA